jgi:hypothetical protein
MSCSPRPARTPARPQLGKPAIPASPAPQCHTRIDPVGFLYRALRHGRRSTAPSTTTAQPVDMTNITIAGIYWVARRTSTLTMNTLDAARHGARQLRPARRLRHRQYFYRYMARRNDAAADYPVEAWLDQTFVASGREPDARCLVGTDADRRLSPTDERHSEEQHG